ncbi:MaoC dehydratase-like protein [Mumia flava]|uniref:MaoC dehydratase-like protein n=1 Tax=Mumia flava TaxID=1348852 RepID=A0A0B2BLA7_9ACTN|nr:MaoC/PaaZ C-terminal domain-containing protein [Mumia flava]PJJ56340.1 MaoC dehydratase-like protein [Mumia flava]
MSGPEVGTPMPPLERTITLTDMVAYAGATWDWHRLHYDTAYTASKGLPGPIVDGQVFGAYLVQALQDWLGPDCFVRSLEIGYRALVFAGETIRCTGEVTESAPDRVALTLRVEVVGAGGTAERTAVAPASAVVLLGSAEGPGGTP